MISIPTSLADIREKRTQKNEITALFYKNQGWIFSFKKVPAEQLWEIYTFNSPTLWQEILFSELYTILAEILMNFS